MNERPVRYMAARKKKRERGREGKTGGYTLRCTHGGPGSPVQTRDQTLDAPTKPERMQLRHAGARLKNDQFEDASAVRLNN